jgi:capsular exopolysaccharide synthesis family protein
VELDLRQLLRIARRRGWIVIVAMVIFAAVGYVYASRQPEMYSARAQIIMMSMPDTGSRYTGLLASQNLKPSYMLIVKSEPVMQAVIDELGLDYSVPALQGKITVGDVPNTQFLNVNVTDRNPEVAARIATATVQEFVNYISNQGDEGLGVPAQVANTARVPGVPFEPRPRYTAQIAAIVGLLVGIVIVALLEYFYNAITPEEDIQEMTSAPLLATVTQLQGIKPGGGQVFMLTQPNSSAAEAMRLLRTNLQFASASREIGKIVISSPGPGEGKSTTAANLAVVVAQGGLTTAIIDADLRKPTLHRIFGVPGDEGVTSMLTNPDTPWTDHAKKVALPGLYLIPSGSIPPNPFDLVSSDRFRDRIEEISRDVDLVIIDSPPILSASDSLAIAAHADGLLLVAQSHKTRTDMLRHAAHSAHQGDVRLVGIVLNRLKGQRGASYYGEYYAAKTASGD